MKDNNSVLLECTGNGKKQCPISSDRLFETDFDPASGLGLRKLWLQYSLSFLDGCKYAGDRKCSVRILDGSAGLHHLLRFFVNRLRRLYATARWKTRV